MKEQGFFLDVLDAALYAARLEGARIWVATDPFGDGFAVVSSAKYFNWCCPCLKFPEEAECKRDDPKSWLILSCNARFAAEGVRNRWIVGYFQQQLTPHEFEYLTVTAHDKDVKEAEYLEVEAAKGEKHLDKMLKEGVFKEGDFGEMFAIKIADTKEKAQESPGFNHADISIL